MTDLLKFFKEVYETIDEGKLKERIQVLGEWRRSADTGRRSTTDVQMVTGLAYAV